MRRQVSRTTYLIFSILFAISAAFWFLLWIRSGGHRFLYAGDTVIFLIAACVWMYGYLRRKPR
jgi:hypothetical protein